MRNEIQELSNIEIEHVVGGRRVSPRSTTGRVINGVIGTLGVAVGTAVVVAASPAAVTAIGAAMIVGGAISIVRGAIGI